MSTSVNAAALLGDKVVSYEAQKTKAAGKGGAEMGKQDFLTLFTAQLKSQNPLDPVKNEAFVAQLAQFSHLEATTNMQTALENFVGSMSNQNLYNSASLIGRRVAVTDAPLSYYPGDTPQASIDLSDAASGITVNISDAKGNVVRQLTAGAQAAGTAHFSWDGMDDAGNPVPAGQYQFSGSAVINGRNTPVSVSTLATVQSVNANPLDGSLTLSLSGGGTLPMSQVKRIAF